MYMEVEIMALINKLLGKDEREEKIKKEISSLEFRKGTVMASITSEIMSLRGGQEKHFLDAGRYAYEVWCKDKTQADLTSFWNEVQELTDKIEVQEAKKKEMAERYDEEIKIIASSLNTVVNSSMPTVSSGSAFCQNCNSVVSDTDVFCQVCGTKLRD